MQDKLITTHVDRLWERALPEGGFAAKLGGNYRPDATAWAILALSAAGTKADHLESSRTRLVNSQHTDGRVCVSPEHPDAFWPTPLAVLAWQGSRSQLEPQSRAIAFLLNTTGRHWQRQADAPAAHNPGLQGWPWIANTHSWVEPTALSLTALQIAGYGKHKRTQEATRMLMDRQLNQGGWNYGNTIVFGQQLRPMPENTGMALNALAGRVTEERVKRSLTYLRLQVKSLRTPLSLGWSLVGMGAWGKRPDNSQRRILESLALQEIYGIYDTPLLGLLVVCFFSSGGLDSIVS
jgi:hypothetical protein